MGHRLWQVFGLFFSGSLPILLDSGVGIPGLWIGITAAGTVQVLHLIPYCNRSAALADGLTINRCKYTQWKRIIKKNGLLNREGRFRELFNDQVVSAESFESCSLESLTVVRMGDGGQQSSTLLIALAVEVYSTPLGNDPMHMES